MQIRVFPLENVVLVTQLAYTAEADNANTAAKMYFFIFYPLKNNVQNGYCYPQPSMYKY